jgi:steroid 5-alpha reductase family enzyme
MTFAALLALAAAAVALFLAAGWMLSVRRRDVSHVDVQWGLGFALIAALGAVLGAGAPARRALVVALVAVWGLRLARHIHARNRGQGEDYRYAAMRARHGARFPAVSLFTVFLLQGALMLWIALPLLVAQTSPEPSALGGLDFAGAALWAVGFLFEAVGDAQLARFRADPANRGQVMDRGLWRYSRHPNYFGDAALWWGLYLIACATPRGGWTLASPLVMTFLLLRVSGVALLEKGLVATKPRYRDYVARTSAFVPWWPRRSG